MVISGTDRISLTPFLAEVRRRGPREMPLARKDGLRAEVVALSLATLLLLSALIHDLTGHRNTLASSTSSQCWEGA